MEGWFFYLFATLAVMSAVATVTRRDAVTSAFWLIFCFLCVAALFALLSAHFMAILQILIYAGAIMVFFLFVTMFLGQEKPRMAGGSRLLPLIALATLVAGAMVMTRLMTGEREAFPDVSQSYGSVEWVSEVLLSRYLFAFELTGLLLTAAVIGAVYLARRQLPGPRGAKLNGVRATDHDIGAPADRPEEVVHHG